MPPNLSTKPPPGPEISSSAPAHEPATDRPYPGPTKSNPPATTETQPPAQPHPRLEPATPTQTRIPLAEPPATKPSRTRPDTPAAHASTFALDLDLDLTSESEEDDAEKNTAMVDPADPPTTPTNTKSSQRPTRFAGTKRPRIDSSPPDFTFRPSRQQQHEPQKPTRSTSKAIAAANYGSEALRLLKLARAIDPKYSHALATLENAIQDKPDKLEQKLDQLLELAKANKPSASAPLYSTVAKNGASATTNPPHAKQTSKTSEPTARTVVLQVADHHKETLKLDPVSLRNQINKAIQATAVATVTRSTKGNIVLTTTKNHSADHLLEKTASWQHVFDGLQVKSAEKPSTWIRLVAHAIPTQLFGGPTDLNVIRDEIHTFNPIKVSGSVGWLTAPDKRQGKRASSIVFTVITEAERKHCLKNGLFIAGEKVQVVNYKAYSPKTQCYRCQGFGHNPATCRKPIKCRLCAGNHHTRDHKCITCNSSNLCGHTEAKCTNCNGNHTANSTECEIFRSIKL